MENESANNKRIAKNTLLLYVRMLFMMLVSLYTSRVVLNTLGVEDFGLYNVVGGFVSMFTFLNGAMASSTQRYMNFELGKGNISNLRAVFSTSINIHACISLLILVLAETIGLCFVYNKLTIPEARFDAALWVYQSAIISTIIMVMSIPYNAAIIAHERMGAFAYISVLEVVLKLAIVYMLTVFSFDKLKLYAVLMLTVQLVIRLIYGSYCKRHFNETEYKMVFNKQLIKDMTGFAGWNLFGNIAVMTYTQGLNVILNMFFGPAVNAARGISVQVQNAIRGFSSNFQTAINPQITKSYAGNDYRYMHKLIFTSSKFSVFLLLVLSMPVMMESKTILTLWLNIVPDHTIQFMHLILVISMIEALANPVVQGALSTGKIRKYQIVVGTTLLMILPFSYLALKLGAVPEYVFIVHLIFAILAHAARLIMSRTLIKISIAEYCRKVIVPIVFVSVISFIVPYIFVQTVDESIFRLPVSCAICVLSTCLSIYCIGLTKNERTFIKTKIRQLSKKISKK